MQMQQPMPQHQRLLQQMNAEPQTPSTGLVLGDQSALCNVLWGTQPRMQPQPAMQQPVMQPQPAMQQPVMQPQPAMQPQQVMQQQVTRPAPKQPVMKPQPQKKKQK